MSSPAIADDSSGSETWRALTVPIRGRWPVSAGGYRWSVAAAGGDSTPTARSPEPAMPGASPKNAPQLVFHDTWQPTQLPGVADPSLRPPRHRAGNSCPCKREPVPNGAGIFCSAATSAETHCHRQPGWGAGDGRDLHPEPVFRRHHRGLEAGDDSPCGGATVGAADRDRGGRHSSAGR